MSVVSLPGPEVEVYITRAELARIAGVSTATVDRWRRAGMPCVVFGVRSVRFRPSTALGWARAYRGGMFGPGRNEGV